MTTVGTTFEMGLREYARMPVLLVLLLFLPAYFVLVFTAVMPDQPVLIDVPVQGRLPVSMSSMTAVLMTPMASALISGVAGLFLMQSARAVDGRLSLSGVRPASILAARFSVLAVVAVTAGIVSLAVLSLTVVPERVGWFLAATVLTGSLYGGIGVVVGLVLNRLAGVYVLMFGPLLDIFVAQSPLATDTPAIAPFLPSHYPMKLAFDAAFTAQVDPGNAWLGAAALLGVWTIATGILSRQLQI